jgi:hypothetical protein
MKSGLITGVVQKTDKDQILELNQIEYGKNDILTTRADFDWRYKQNPAGEAIVPVVRDECNNIIGFIWIVPLHIRIERQDYLAATGTNLVIHPHYRNSFAYIKLIRRFEQVFNEQDIPLHFSFVSEIAYRQQKKHNPHMVSTIPFLIKPLNFKSLAQTYFTKNWQRFISGQIGQLISLFLFRPRPADFTEQIMVQVIDRFDKRFDDFWFKIQDKYPTIVVRNQASLAWRFAELSDRKYTILVAQTADGICGYAVLRCSIIRNVNAGLILDFLTTDDEAGKRAASILLAQAETYFRRKQMSLIATIMSSCASEYHYLRHAGYIHWPAAFSPRPFRFAHYLHDNSPHQLRSLPASNWFVTLADYESQ